MLQKEKIKNKVKASFVKTSILLMMGGLLFLTAGEGAPLVKINVKVEEVNKLNIAKIKDFFRYEPCELVFSPKDEIVVAGKPLLGENELAPLLIIGKGRIKVFWIYIKPFLFFLACSPDGRFIAYHTRYPSPGIWILDTITKETKLVAKEVIKGKIINGIAFGFLDPEHLIIEREDLKLIEEFAIAKAKFEMYISEKDRERLHKLIERFLRGEWRKDDQKELSKILEETLPRIKKEEIEAGSEAARWTRSLYESVETRLVDVVKAEEKELLLKGEEILSISQDRKWFYIGSRVLNKVFKINIDDPSKREEVLSWYTPGLRILGEQPLRICIFQLGLPPSYICKCYVKRDGKLVLEKTIFYGDKKFPKSSFVILSPNIRYSSAYGKDGLFLKQLKTGKIKKVDTRKIVKAIWHESSTKIAYIAKGKETYEVWIYEVDSGKKQKLFPVGDGSSFTKRKKTYKPEISNYTLNKLQFSALARRR